MNGQILSRMLDLTNSKSPFVVVTLLSTRGHVPQDPGAKAIVTPRGLDCGTVGGGKLEASAVSYAQKLLHTSLLSSQTATPEIVTWNLKRDIGMTCGGEAQLLFETYISQSWIIAVFGAGHVGQALIRILVTLDCDVVCVDPRKEWLDRLPYSQRLLPVQGYDFDDAREHFGEKTFFVVVTKGHATDIPILQKAFSKYPNAPYFGVIGSERKAAHLKSELQKSGISAELLSKLRCPVGLPFGKNNPAEIAISIAAELIKIRDDVFGKD
ncbi:MAG: XdhC family protein [Candidatus Loosdrechtia sp.]|uniref:XdhC family protein n=1 Tax=Candidatus Loosdrechtia sp. TaxID=3101272 RepID=UPI003A731FC3|nr:MAG: XdhC family protein [Candidatus Jettenia sp. AMX2]